MIVYMIVARLIEGILRLRLAFGGAAILRERLALGPPHSRADIWVHAASVGELTSARFVVEALSARFRVQITTNSLTGRKLATEWGFPARLAPVDLPGALDRFLAAVQPRLALTIEAELWPLRSGQLARLGIPQAVIGARISARSAARWRRLPWLITPVLKRLTLLSAQDEASEARLRRLGLAEMAISAPLDLKLLAPAQITPPDGSPQRDQVILAASTHAGEDAAIIDAWIAARAAQPDLRLILAPRHPGRGDEVAALFAARGLPFSRRSEGADDGAVLLADTIGEMPNWYRRAAICIVGGSLIEKDGHTPWEPAAYACAILHGPHVSNHKSAYAMLDQAGAGREVTADSLAATLTALTSAPAITREMGNAARQVLLQRVGDAAHLIHELTELANS